MPWRPDSERCWYAASVQRYSKGRYLRQRAPPTAQTILWPGPGPQPLQHAALDRCCRQRRPSSGGYLDQQPTGPQSSHWQSRQAWQALGRCHRPTSSTAGCPRQTPRVTVRACGRIHAGPRVVAESGVKCHCRRDRIAPSSPPSCRRPTSPRLLPQTSTS